MSNKCFITKYQANIDNENLPRLGELKFEVTATKTGTVKDGYGDFSIGGNNISIISSVPIYKEGIADAGIQFEVATEGSNFLLPVGSSAIIRVKNKYGITNMNQGFDRVGYSSCTLDLSDLKYCTSIITIVANSTGDISNLKDMTGMTTLSIGANSTGDISNLKDMTGMTTLSIGANCTGDIDNLKSMVNLTGMYSRGSKIYGNITNFLNNCTKLKHLTIPSAVVITDEQKKAITDRGCTLMITD